MAIRLAERRLALADVCVYKIAMGLVFNGFDWDEGNRSKCARHGVSRAEIEAAFDGELIVSPDPEHSGDEARFIAIGRNGEGRPLFVAFTFRDREGHHYVRPISARYMHAKEVKAHEASRS